MRCFKKSLVLLCLTTLYAVAESAFEGLIVEITEKPAGCDDGTLRKARKGDIVSQDYIGRLENGTKFDSSYDRGQPFVFRLGVGEVIIGMDEAMKEMCVGERRTVVIPPEYAYGDRGFLGGKIPGGATLYFEIQLVGLEIGGPPDNIFFEIDTSNDGYISRNEMNTYMKLMNSVLSQTPCLTCVKRESEDETEDEVNRLFRFTDWNSDTYISSSEFYHPEYYFVERKRRMINMYELPRSLIS